MSETHSEPREEEPTQPEEEQNVNDDDQQPQAEDDEDHEEQQRKEQEQEERRQAMEAEEARLREEEEKRNELQAAETARQQEEEERQREETERRRLEEEAKARAEEQEAADARRREQERQRSEEESAASIQAATAEDVEEEQPTVEKKSKKKKKDKTRDQEEKEGLIKSGNATPATSEQVLVAATNSTNSAGASSSSAPVYTPPALSPSQTLGGFTDLEKENAPELQATPVAKESRHDFAYAWFTRIGIGMAVFIGILAIVLYSIEAVEASHVARAISAFCAIACTILTAFLIYLHGTVYTNPKQQRLIVRILLMCPIYAIDSYIALQAYKSAPVIGLIRDTYEAYVIYMFFNLLMDYLGGETATCRFWENSMPTMKHLFPFHSILPEFKLNARTLRIWKLCLLQYMLLNPAMTLLSIPLYYGGYYEEGKLDAANAYVYFAMIQFISVTFAFTSLVYFFFAIKDQIPEQKPMAKFAAIKTVVFLTFWQSVLLGVLNYFGAIPSSRLWTSSEVSTGLNDFVVAIEMFCIAIAHRWCFSDAIYRPPDGRRPFASWVFWHMISIKDVLKETEEQLISPVTSAVKRKMGTSTEGSNERQESGYGAV